MKIDDIPQQGNELFSGETKGVYAVNDDGKLELAQTAGWEAESTVLQQALEEIDRLTIDALERVNRGSASTLEFHMHRQRMDLAMLAQAAGRFKWQVKRHFKPEVFSKLNNSDLELYADILNISVTELRQLPNSPKA